MSLTTFNAAEIETRMRASLEALKRELSGLRTGRASAHLLDPVQVMVYGSRMPLNQVASVSVPEPRMISVQVWDRSNVTAVPACGVVCEAMLAIVLAGAMRAKLGGERGARPLCALCRVEPGQLPGPAPE